METTLILIKPDGVQRSLSGEILSRLEKSGLKICGLKFFMLMKNLQNNIMLNMKGKTLFQ
ncbi:MAG: hypothetical protein Ct9H90mP2_08800 [Dehalococcoidia bacterium]|nr:MAG: hypothetical protein Ct9H90mP2_08800 [Dehalococcoidia bacterium]